MSTQRIWWTGTPPPWLVGKMNALEAHLAQQIAANVFALPLLVTDDATHGLRLWATCVNTQSFQAYPSNLTPSMFPLAVTISSGGKAYPTQIP
jgi:hypothetical protein